jgi:hypothetical protein
LAVWAEAGSRLLDTLKQNLNWTVPPLRSSFHIVNMKNCSILLEQKFQELSRYGIWIFEISVLFKKIYQGISQLYNQCVTTATNAIQAQQVFIPPLKSLATQKEWMEKIGPIILYLLIVSK